MSKRTKIFILLTVGAILTGLSVTFSKQLGFLEWVSITPVVIALKMLCDNDGLKLRRVYLFGLFYFEIFYAVCFHWFISLYPLDFTGLNNFYSVLVVIVAWFGLPLLQALFGGFVFVICVLISRTVAARKYPIINVFTLTAVYTFYEYTQTLGWWGVPWGRLALGQVDIWCHIETASLFGSYFVTAVILLVNSLIAFGILSLKNVKRYATFALAVYLLNFCLSIGLYFAEEKRIEDAETVTVGVVQGNFSSTDKWSGSIEQIVAKHLRLTEESAKNGAEVIVWAETALPIPLRENSYYSQQISDTAKKFGITILVGALESSLELDRNAIICYNPDGTRNETIYAKRHLVPFGEYVPMRGVIETVLPFLSEISILDDDWMPGDDSAIFDTDSGKIGSLICFDSIYESLARDSVRDGAELLAISTNDSWFSDSAAIYMHNNQARLRAIENGRFVARSANTGLSAFITSHGDVISTIAPLEEGYLNSEVALLSHRTLFNHIGNTIVFIMGALALTPLVIEAILKIKQYKNRNSVNISLQKGENNEEQ